MSSRRWAWTVLGVAAWAAYLSYFGFSSTGHGDTLPAQIEGLVRIVLVVGTAAVAACFYIVRQHEAAISQRVAELRWNILGLREEVRRIGPYRVIGRAEVETTVPLVQVPDGAVRRRPRPSKVAIADGPIEMYLSDYAEAYEAGRQAGLAERDKPEG